MCIIYLEPKRKEHLTKRVFGSDKGDINVRGQICFRWSDGIKTAQNVRSVMLKSTR